MRLRRRDLVAPLAPGEIRCTIAPFDDELFIIYPDAPIGEDQADTLRRVAWSWPEDYPNWEWPKR